MRKGVHCARVRAAAQGTVSRDKQRRLDASLKLNRLPLSSPSTEPPAPQRPSTGGQALGGRVQFGVQLLRVGLQFLFIGLQRPRRGLFDLLAQL